MLAILAIASESWQSAILSRQLQRKSDALIAHLGLLELDTPYLPPPAWKEDQRPIFNGVFWIKGDGAFPVLRKADYMAGAIFGGVPGGNEVSPGEFLVEPPTLLNLGFEWRIQGDDNHNAAGAVQYRKAGESMWRQAQPLLRIGDEKVWRAREFLEYWTPRMFAGSILDLEEATTYECRFTMSDPDGVNGESVRQVNVTTRATPKIPTGGRTLHVYPPDYEGPKQEPSFKGLKEAYYGPGLGDWDVVRTRPVQPGDVILVHAGLYKADRMDYVTPYGVPFDGAYVLTRDGTPEKPIVIKGAGDGEAIFDGNGCFYGNIVYNVPMGGAIKNGGANPAGVLVYHNTFVAENSNVRGNSNMHYRNNLILGINHPERPVLGNLTYTSYSSFDYNGYRPNPNGKPQFVWKAPAEGELRNYTIESRPFQNFSTLAEFQRATGQEPHGKLVDYDVFNHVSPPDPARPHVVYEVGDLDFRLRAGGVAVDAGCVLANINDGFTGKAPDLGALETGRPTPVYGPRP